MESLIYEFTCTAAPVQAEGTLCGHPFYFRARYKEWRFSVSENLNVDPVGIRTPEQGEMFGFFLEGNYGGGKYAASYMPLQKADQIIRTCAEKYLQGKGLK